MTAEVLLSRPILPNALPLHILWTAAPPQNSARRLYLILYCSSVGAPYAEACLGKKKSRGLKNKSAPYRRSQDEKLQQGKPLQKTQKLWVFKEID